MQSVRRRWQEEFVAGDRVISVKTIAWGMPDVSGASAVNTRAHTHTTLARTRLRVHWAPGIPRALFLRGEEISGKARACHAARLRMRVDAG
jgi:hypothetical protein